MAMERLHKRFVPGQPVRICQCAEGMPYTSWVGYIGLFFEYDSEKDGFAFIKLGDCPCYVNLYDIWITSETPSFRGATV